MEQDLKKSQDLVAKIRNLAFLLKESHKKVSDDEYERNILNLLSYSTLLEKHYLTMRNTHYATSMQSDRQQQHQHLKPAFRLASHLASQKARELLD